MEKNRGERNESILEAGLLCRTEHAVQTLNSRHLLSAQLRDMAILGWGGGCLMDPRNKCFRCNQVKVLWGLGRTVSWLPRSVTRGSTGICFSVYTINLTDHLSRRLSRKVVLWGVLDEFLKDCRQGVLYGMLCGAALLSELSLVGPQTHSIYVYQKKGAIKKNLIWRDFWQSFVIRIILI